VTSDDGRTAQELPRRARAPAYPIVRRGVRLLAGSLVAFLLLTAAGVLVGGGADVLRHMTGLRVPVLLAVFGLALSNYLLRAWRWHRYSRALALDIGPRESATYFLAGLSMGATPGKLGEALRLWMIARDHGYTYSRTVPLFLADRLNDVQALLLLCVVGAAASLDSLVPAAAGAALVVALSLLLAHGDLLRRAVGALYAASARRGGRWFARARRVLRLTSGLLTRRVAVPALALGVAAWGAECAALHLILDGFGAQTTAYQALFVYAFATLAGALSMLPGGIGGFEAASVLLLVSAGVDTATAVAATAIVRVATLWFSVALGLAVLPFALHPAKKEMA